MESQGASIDTDRSVGQAEGVETEVLFAAVPVADLAAAIPWYEGLFGRAADLVANDDEVLWRVADGGWLTVVRDAPRAGHAVVTISVGDLERSVVGLATRGISTGPIEVVGEAGLKAFMNDPDGNQIALIEVFAAR